MKISDFVFSLFKDFYRYWINCWHLTLWITFGVKINLPELAGARTPRVIPNPQSTHKNRRHHHTENFCFTPAISGVERRRRRARNQNRAFLPARVACCVSCATLGGLGREWRYLRPRKGRGRKVERWFLPARSEGRRRSGDRFGGRLLSLKFVGVGGLGVYSKMCWEINVE